MKEWLNFLRLGEYNDMLTRQGYTDIDIVTGIMWEDLEDIGIQKLGVNSLLHFTYLFKFSVTHIVVFSSAVLSL